MLTQSIVNEIDIIFFAHLPCPGVVERAGRAAAVAHPAVGLRRLALRDLGRHPGLHRPTVRRAAPRRRGRGARSTRCVSRSSPASSSPSSATWWCRSCSTSLKVPEVRDAAERLPELAPARHHVDGGDLRLQGVLRRHRQDPRPPRQRGRDERAQHRALLRSSSSATSARRGWASPARASRAVVSTYVGLAIMIVYALLPEYRGFRLFDLRRVTQASRSTSCGSRSRARSRRSP